MQKSQPAHPSRSVFRRLARIFLKTLLTLLIILLLVFFLIQTPFIQNIIRGKAENYLSRKLKTPVRIGYLHVSFFTEVTLKDIYIGDRQKDTLLSAGLIDVEVRMWGLLHNNLDISRVQLKNFTVKIKRQLPDTSFNFQFVVDAFSGPSTPSTGNPASKPMKLGLRSLLLDKIRFVYKDTVTGNDMEIAIDHSLIKIAGIDLAQLRFDIPQFELDGLRARVYQGRALSTLASTASAAGAAPAAGSPASSSSGTSASSSAAGTGLPQFNLGFIHLKNSVLDYRNTVSAIYAGLQLGQLMTNVQRFDLDREIIQLKDLQLDSTSTAVRLGKTPVPASPKPQAAPPDTSGWRILAGSLRINENQFQFDDDNQKKQKTGMDYAHLSIRQLSFAADKLSYSPDSVSGSIAKASFSEQSGFRLTRLTTRFFYSDHRAGLMDFFLQTPGTLLQRSASLNYVSLAGIMKNPARTLVDLDLPNSRIQVKDILVFVPSLVTQPAFSHPEEIWQINARLKGSLDAVTIQTLQFSGMQDLRLDMAGRVLHPLDTRRAQADLDIRSLSGSRSLLIDLLPKGSLPQNIAIPEHFTVTGKLAGTMDGIQSGLVLTTSSGTVLLNGYARNIRSTTRATYDLDLQTKSFDLGAILRDSVHWGRITGEFTVKGQGLDYHSANASMTAQVSTATIRQYTYRNFSLDGSIADQHAEIQSSIRDTAIRFDLKASAGFASKYPTLQLDWQIDTLDLHALHFVKDTLQFKGHVAARFADTNPDSLQGELKLSALQLLMGTQSLATDSIVLVAARREDLEDIQLHSEMADLDWNGRYKLTETARALQQLINHYYHLDNYKDTAFALQDWSMRFNFRPSPLVLAYMPSLKGTDSIGAVLTFDSRKDDFHLEGKTPRLQFGSQVVEQLNLTASTGNGRLNYDLQIAGGSGSGLNFHRSYLAGDLHDNQISTALVLEDDKGKKRFRLAARLDKAPGGLKFVVNPDSLLLNYETWKVSRDNFIEYDSAGILVHDFVISDKNDSLSVNSLQSDPASPIHFHFANFTLGTISRLTGQDSLFVDGTLNGTAEIKNTLSHPTFTSDLQIRGLSQKPIRSETSP